MSAENTITCILFGAALGLIFRIYKYFYPD
jgi:hypothetical protein